MMIRKLALTTNRLLGIASILVFFTSTASAQLAVTGIVRAVEEVVIKSELSGVVQHIAVMEGERVQQGQLLIELDNEHQKLNLALSRAGLDKAKVAVEETQVLLSNAERESERLEIAGNAVPRKELEDIRDQILRIKASISEQMAEIIRVEQEVKVREQDLKDTQILAPFTGTVTELFINKGESIRPLDTPILELVGLDQMYAELRLPSSYVRSVSVGQAVNVQVESEWLGRTGQLVGHVSYINPTVDAASRTFKIKVEIPVSKGVVRPGMLVEARF